MQTFWWCRLLCSVKVLLILNSHTQIQFFCWNGLNDQVFNRIFVLRLSFNISFLFFILSCNNLLTFFIFCDFFWWQADSVERFHISAFILFVLAQNILEAEGPWFESFLTVRFGNILAPTIYWRSLVCYVESISLLTLVLLLTYILFGAEYSLGVCMWNGYWYYQAFIHC